MPSLRLAVPLVGIALILAACSSGGGAAATPVPSAAAPSPAASAPAASASAAADAGVKLADVALGRILTDAAGRTLYVFTSDTAGTSTCSGDCAAKWPPLATDAVPTLGTGLDAEDFTVIKRDDGSGQLAFYGHPLYTFAGDAAAGDTNGQGIGDKWFAVGADGAMIGASPAPSKAAASAPAASTAAVNVGDTSLGKVLTDGQGRTLYAFTADSGGASACYEDCAAAWPPLTSDATPTLGAGVDASKVGSIQRTDGGRQVTYAGMPLYLFGGDAAAGDTNGQGIAGKWFAVGAAGTLVK
jgi:predicted lipoprotein with Yx(FWY)xxD motif